MSIRKSTRHSLIDDSKINLDDQDPPPIIGDSIQPNDAWVQVYQKMIDSGWNWLAGSGLSDYHYLKPGITEVKGKILNVDYFSNEEHLQQYATEKYGWENTLNATYGEDILSTEFQNASTKISLQNEKPSFSKKKIIDKDLLSLEDDDFDHFPGKESSPINILETTRPSKLSKKEKINSTLRTKTIIKTEKGEPNPVVEKEIISDAKCFSPVTKGSKTKPGLITLSQKHDIRLGKNIAFDLDSEVGSQLKTYFDDNIPSGAINIVEKDNEIKKYIFGVVNKVTTTKGRKSHYQIAWNYSSKQLYPVDLKDELVDIARNLYLSLKKKPIKNTQKRKD